jgi:hypothetical protein
MPGAREQQRTSGVHGRASRPARGVTRGKRPSRPVPSRLVSSSSAVGDGGGEERKAGCGHRRPVLIGPASTSSGRAVPPGPRPLWPARRDARELRPEAGVAPRTVEPAATRTRGEGVEACPAARTKDGPDGLAATWSPQTQPRVA